MHISAIAIACPLVPTHRSLPKFCQLVSGWPSDDFYESKSEFCDSLITSDRAPRQMHWTKHVFHEMSSQSQVKHNQTGGRGWILSSHYLQTFGAAVSSKKVLAVTVCCVEIILIADPPPHHISALC